MSTKSIVESPDLVNEGPLLSVIVPCYKVEDYLKMTLDSIISQKGVNLEIIVIDDGSPDRSGEIASEYAAHDSRVQVHRKKNGGLGAARNSGIAIARGKYVTFADSDDTIPPGSYAAMVDKLEESGSDFVIGTMERRLGNRTWVPDWAKQVHKNDRTRIRLEDDLEVLKDVFACNKVFNRVFWDERVQAFPENIRYEDQEATAKAFTASRAFDVLERVVYTWIIREDGSSITQQKSRIEDLEDRLKVMDSVSAVLRRNSSDAVHKEWAIKSIGFDLKPYYDQIPRTNSDYWDLLVQGVKKLAGNLESQDWVEVPFWDRVLALSAVFGCAEDTAIIQASKQEHASGFEVISIPAGELNCSADFLADLSFALPPSMLIPSNSSLRLRAELHDLFWISETSVEILGSARVSGIGSNNFAYKVSLEIEDPSEATSTIRIPAETTTTSLPDLSLNDAYNSYEETFFKAVVDVAKLDLLVASRDVDIVRSIGVNVDVAGISRSGPFSAVSVLGRAGSLRLGKLIDNERFAASYHDDSGLTINVPTRKPIARTVSVSGRHVDVTVDPNGVEGLDRLLLRSKRARDVVVKPADTSSTLLSFSFELPNPDFPSYKDVLTEIRVGSKHKSNLLQFDGSSEDADDIAGFESRIRIDLSRKGFLRIVERHFAISVDSTEINALNGELIVSGEFDVADRASLRLYFESPSSRIQPIRVHFDKVNGRFSTTFPLTVDTWDKPGVSVSTGGYALKAILAGSKLDQAPYWVPIAQRVHNEYPKHELVPGVARIRMARTKQAVALWLNVYAPLDEGALGKFAQRSLIRSRQVAHQHTLGKLQEATLFESFGGAGVADSPKALFEYARKESLGGKLYWTVRDGSVKVPAGAEGVILHSQKYHELLATSQYLINNNNFPFYYRKPEGQIYLQTWHGTPLKKIGYDVPKSNLSISYRRLMAREAHYWDAMIAQNEYSVPHFKRAFGFEGPIWTEGYPRNDSLVDVEAMSRSNYIRGRFGFTPDTHVVLYAPTWRDNVKTASSNYDLVSYLDFDKIYEEFGDKVQILLRGHSNTSKALRTFSHSNVTDVSSYSDVNDLMLASDMLITDYSSIMFDYVATQKPVAILAPDLDLYESQTRGFYYDFRSDLPGPLLMDTNEVLDFLSSDMEEYAHRVDSYVNRFGSQDDGFAAKRVGDRLWN